MSDGGASICTRAPSDSSLYRGNWLNILVSKVITLCKKMPPPPGIIGVDKIGKPSKGIYDDALVEGMLGYLRVTNLLDSTQWFLSLLVL
jgi:hypothetical protein